jgi:hypothetical protein
MDLVKSVTGLVADATPPFVRAAIANSGIGPGDALRYLPAATALILGIQNRNHIKRLLEKRKRQDDDKDYVQKRAKTVEGDYPHTGRHTNDQAEVERLEASLQKTEADRDQAQQKLCDTQAKVGQLEANLQKIKADRDQAQKRVYELEKSDPVSDLRDISESDSSNSEASSESSLQSQVSSENGGTMSANAKDAFDIKNVKTWDRESLTAIVRPVLAKGDLDMLPTLVDIFFRTEKAEKKTQVKLRKALKEIKKKRSKGLKMNSDLLDIHEYGDSFKSCKSLGVFFRMHETDLWLKPNNESQATKDLRQKDKAMYYTP